MTVSFYSEFLADRADRILIQTFEQNSAASLIFFAINST